jgi:hypothetical protein
MSEKHDQGQKGAGEKKPAKAVSSGSKMTFKLASAKKVPVIALLSKIWSSANVGIFIDVPITGTPQTRMLMGCYGVYAVEKAAQKIFKSADYGIFNPQMRKFGIEMIEGRHNISSDGAPTNLRIELTAKSHKVGTVLASLLAKMQFEPPTSDLSSLLLSRFPKDLSVLQGIAQKFYEELNNHSMIALIGGKRASVNESVAEKFDHKFEVAYRKPEFGKTSGPSGQIDLMPEMHAFGLKIAAGNPAAAIVTAHALSRHGTVWQTGNVVELTADPEYAYYARRLSINFLANMNRTSMMLAWYQKQADTDVVNEKSVSTVLAIAGIACGLPIASMIEVLSMKTLSIPPAAKAANNAAEALKAEKIAKPVKPSAAPQPQQPSKKKPSSGKKKADGSELSDDEEED